MTAAAPYYCAFAPRGCKKYENELSTKIANMVANSYVSVMSFFNHCCLSFAVGFWAVINPHMSSGQHVYRYMSQHGRCS